MTGRPTEIPSIREFLRDEAEKLIVFVSDENVTCVSEKTGVTIGSGPDGGDEQNTVVEPWETALQTLAPEKFGASSDERRFSVWSIVGQAPFAPTSDNPGGRPAPPDLNTAPVTDATCGPDAVNAGRGYQAMSLTSGGYRFPSCEDDYSEFFKLMSQKVVTESKIPCQFDAPQRSADLDVLVDTIQMSFRAPGTQPETFDRVSFLSECSDAAFLIDERRITLCPQACERVSAAPDSELGLLFGCDLDLR